MLFPEVETIATKEVVTVSHLETVAQASAVMNRHELRDVVVTGNAPGDYRILTVNDMIRLWSRGVPFSTELNDLDLEQAPRVKRGSNVLDVLQSIRGHHVVCILDDEGGLVGVVTYTDIITSIDPRLAVEAQQVGEMIYSNTVRSVPSGTRMSDAAAFLRDSACDAVVVEKEGKPIGIVTTRDVIGAMDPAPSPEQTVDAFMTSPLETVRYDATVKEALEFVQAKHFRRVVVVDDAGRLIGVVTQHELASKVYSKWAELLREHEEELRELNTVLENRARQLERMATTDRLTGIWNRNKFEETVNREIGRSDRYEENHFSLILFDIDHFKKVNDTHGHLVGDQVLKEVARRVAEAVRTTDMVARWGGEEFVVLLPQTDVNHAAQAAEKLRAALEAAPFEGVGSVTASFGVARYRRGDTPETLVRRADDALYLAKRQGRNRVMICKVE